MHSYSSLINFPFFLNPYTWIFIVSLYQIYIFAGNRLTHPLAIFFLYIILYFPLKYLLINIFDFDYTYFANSIGNFKESGYIEFAGYIFLIYLLFSIIFFHVFKVSNILVPIFAIGVKIKFYGASLKILILLIFLVIIIIPINDIFNGILIRNFLSTKGMGYLLAIYQLFVNLAIIQLIALKQFKKLIFFLAINIIFTIFAGSFSQMITWITLVLLMEFMVYCKYPKPSTLFFLFLLIFIFALLHGFVRVQGNLLLGLQNLINVSDNEDIAAIISTLARLFIDRVDQLEEFSLLVGSIAEGKVETNLYWPINFLIQIVPRFLWEDKPYFFSAHMMSIFYPEVLNEGVTFNFLGLGELIYTFGFLGVLFAGLITGFLFYITEIYIVASKSNPDVFAFYFLIFFFYLNAGFHGGWLNSPILAFSLINVCVFLFLGKVRYFFARIN